MAPCLAACLQVKDIVLRQLALQCRISCRVLLRQGLQPGQAPTLPRPYLDCTQTLCVLSLQEDTLPGHWLHTAVLPEVLRWRHSAGTVAACRKAYRLGKWLSDLNTLRSTPVLTKAGALELLASGGEGVYYFVEQLTW